MYATFNFILMMCVVFVLICVIIYFHCLDMRRQSGFFHSNNSDNCCVTFYRSICCKVHPDSINGVEEEEEKV